MATSSSKNKFEWKFFFLGLFMLVVAGYGMCAWKTYSYVYDLRHDHTEAFEVAIVWPIMWYEVLKELLN